MPLFIIINEEEDLILIYSKSHNRQAWKHFIIARKDSFCVKSQMDKAENDKKNLGFNYLLQTHMAIRPKKALGIL